MNLIQNLNFLRAAINCFDYFCLNEAIAHDHHEQFDTLRSQIREIQNRMANEQVIRDILFLSITRDVSRYDLPRVSDEFSSAIKIEHKIDSVVKQNTKLIEKKLAKEARDIEQQCKDRLSEEFKERIQTLQAQKEAQDIEIEEQKQATEQVLRQSQDMLKQKQEAFAENQVLQDQKAQLERELSLKVKEIKQAKDQNEKYQEEISKMSEEIKESASHLVESKEAIRDRIEDFMSNMKNNHFIPRRLQCSDLACKNHRFYFCRDHQVYSCKGCTSKMHYKCQIAIIQDLTDLRTDIKEVQKHVLRFQELATENGLEMYLPNINSVIKDYQEDLTEIE